MIWLSEHHLPLLWEYLGYYGISTYDCQYLFLTVLAKKAWFCEISPKLIIQYKFESFKNQIMNISFFLTKSV